MTSTVLRLEAAFRKIADGSEDDLYKTATRTPNASGFRIGDSQRTADVLRNYLQQIDSGSFSGVEFLQLDVVSSVETAKGYFDLVSMVHATLAAADTITIGGLVLTWQVAAANENEITIGVDALTDAANLAAAINGHSQLAGLVNAEVSGSLVLIRTMGCSRWGKLLTLSTSNAIAMVLFSPRFVPVTFGAVLVAANPVFTIDPATFDQGTWDLTVGQGIDCWDPTLVTQRNTVGPLVVVSVSANVVTLEGDAADLAAIGAGDVFAAIQGNQAYTQRMNYGANIQ